MTRAISICSPSGRGGALGKDYGKKDVLCYGVHRTPFCFNPTLLYIYNLYHFCIASLQILMFKSQDVIYMDFMLSVFDLLESGSGWA